MCLNELPLSFYKSLHETERYLVKVIFYSFIPRKSHALLVKMGTNERMREKKRKRERWEPKKIATVAPIL